jgi:predicted SAM-dependent methyltransferase
LLSSGTQQEERKNVEATFGPRLNLGCGPVQPIGWINIDGSNRARLAGWLPWLDRSLQWLGVLPPTEFGPHIRVLNLFKPLPWAPNSVGGIYAGELWEHFEYADAERLTRDCHRVLRPGGVLRVTVPDAAQLWGKYMRLYEHEMAKPRSERSAAALLELMASFFEDIATSPKWMLSWGHCHKWFFDQIQLIDMFERCGFREVERMRVGDSRIPGIDSVQRSDMLTVEGVKS